MMNRTQFFSHRRNDTLRTSAALWMCALVALTCLLGFFRITRADMGPKSSIRINVTNPPEDDYYIALLGKEESGEYDAAVSGQIMEDIYRSSTEEEQYILDFLFAYHQDGYSFHLEFRGAGSLAHSNHRHSYNFYYHVPSDFKVILFGTDGSIVISDSVSRAHFKSHCTFDASTGKLTEDPSDPVSYLFSAVGCLLITLLIEFVILLVFSLSVRKNFLRFLVTNLITQVFLNITTITLDRIGIRGLLFIILWLITEILIVIIEALSYMDHLKDKKDAVKSGYNIAYAITANVVSALCEIPILLIASMLS